LRRGEIDQVSRDLKVSRKGKQRTDAPYSPRAPRNLFASYDSPPRAPSRFAMESSSGVPKLSFGDMDDDDDDDNKENSPPPTNKKLFGGLRKRRSYKKRKTRTNKRKRSMRAKKGTRRRRH